MTYSDLFCNALAYAAEAHKEQRRKRTSIPYISHLLGVTAIVLDAGGDETEAIAAVLHDVVEDQPLQEGGGKGRLADVRARFGDHVAKIVESLSDWVSSDINKKKENSSYADRKITYHNHLRLEADKSVLIVSAADKLHNVRAMETDFNRIGDELWDRFNGSREQILWNFEQLIAIYRTAVLDDRRAPIVEELATTVERLKSKPAPSTPTVSALR